jgi:hypothetical protein
MSARAALIWALVNGLGSMGEWPLDIGIVHII